MGLLQPRRLARPQPLLLIIALELWVMNRNAARYTRAFAWTKLLKFWTSSRSDDLLGLVPQCLQFRGRGLCGLLQRTKTSGPGKKVKWLPIFVDRDASFAGVPWLETGFALWQEDGMCFERDYLVPLPSQNRESCVQYMADYTAMCALSKELYCLLRRPVFLPPQWHLAEEPLLITFSACRAWTEHSERCWLTSVAAILGIGREQRELLGRWRVSACSDEYIRTAHRVISQLQRSIVHHVWLDCEWQVKDIGLSDFEEFLQETGLQNDAIQRQLELFKLRNDLPEQAASNLPTNLAEVPYASAQDSTGEIPCAEPISPPAAAEAAEIPNQETFRYFVCITKKPALTQTTPVG